MTEISFPDADLGRAGFSLTSFGDERERPATADRRVTRQSVISNSDAAAQLPRHRWCPIKEGFSPSLVRLCVQDWANAPKVLDPFSGGGTTAVTAAQQGGRGVGIEVNPYLAFVGKAKLSRPSLRSFMAASKRVMEAAKRARAASPLECYSTFGPEGGSEKFLFNTPVLRAFYGGWRLAAPLPASVRRPLQLALISAAMDVCNAKRDGKCFRYKRDWANLGYGRSEFVERLRGRLESIEEDLRSRRARHLPGTARIYVGDARTSGKGAYRSGPFDALITSPPYLNSLDYSDVYRPELFLGGFMSSTGELAQLRLNTVRSHIQVDWSSPIRSDFGPQYRETMRQLSARKDLLWNRRLLLMVQAYFEDMGIVLHRALATMKRGAPAHLVVSTSAYAGV